MIESWHIVLAALALLLGLPFYVYIIFKFGGAGFQRGVQHAKRHIGGFDAWKEKQRAKRASRSFGSDES